MAPEEGGSEHGWEKFWNTASSSHSQVGRGMAQLEGHPEEVRDGAGLWGEASGT